MVKKIGDKMTNVKRSWRECKALQERSGWGLTAENNEESINAFIEKKYPLFWHLDTIWGSRPNVIVMASRESVTVHVAGTQAYSQLPDPLLDSSAAFDIVSSSFTVPTSAQHSLSQCNSTPPTSTASVLPTSDESSSTESPPPEITVQKEVQAQKLKRKSNLKEEAKQILNARYTTRDDQAAKKLKVASESAERIARIQAESVERSARIQVESSERAAQRVAEIYAAANTQHMQHFTHIIEIMSQHD
ncbi:hypothetical protein BDZ91DRAFT_838457 [Kalaharituber pfeilii]|nr:hypothetical protein BDZ91DRAFT_838457 [Kalaharituber pfeilii]